MSILLSNKGNKDAQDPVCIGLGLGRFVLIACRCQEKPVRNLYPKSSSSSRFNGG